MDKYLTEAMGECWHSYKPAKIPYCDSDTTIDSFKCSCGYTHGWCEQSFINHVYRNNPDFSTWEGFGKLWEWAAKQEWWLEFIKQATYLDNSPEEIEADTFHLKLGIVDFIVPTKFAKAVFLYLQNKS